MYEYTLHDYRALNQSTLYCVTWCIQFNSFSWGQTGQTSCWIKLVCISMILYIKYQLFLNRSINRYTWVIFIHATNSSIFNFNILIVIPNIVFHRKSKTIFVLNITFLCQVLNFLGCPILHFMMAISDYLVKGWRNFN